KLKAAPAERQRTRLRRSLTAGGCGLMCTGGDRKPDRPSRPRWRTAPARTPKRRNGSTTVPQSRTVTRATRQDVITSPLAPDDGVAVATGGSSGYQVRAATGLGEQDRPAG